VTPRVGGWTPERRGRDAGVVTVYRSLGGLGALLNGAAVTVCLLVPLAGVAAVAGGAPAVSGATLVEANGRGVLVPLALFLALATGAAVSLSQRGRVILTGGHLALTLLALPSIGLLFVPASAVLVLAAVVDVRGSVTARQQRSFATPG
jgi:hypothetical protein